VTGTLAEPYIRKLAGAVREKYPNVQAEVIPVINHFFGELITVSGLLTGQDILEQLKGRDLGDELLLPENMLRSGERVLLDDVTVEDLEVSLQIKVRIVESDGQSLVRALTGGET
jgi:NifB/MoaA-like Fe-S oxidoreductase